MLNASFSLVLPGVIGDTKEPPNRANVEQILQFKMFGDAKHTGNGTSSGILWSLA